MCKPSIVITDTPRAFSINVNGQHIPNITEYTLTRNAETQLFKLTISLEVPDNECSLVVEKGENGQLPQTVNVVTDEKNPIAEAGLQYLRDIADKVANETATGRWA